MFTYLVVQKHIIIPCPMVEAVFHLLHRLDKRPEIGITCCESQHAATIIAEIHPQAQRRALHCRERSRRLKVIIASPEKFTAVYRRLSIMVAIPQTPLRPASTKNITHPARQTPHSPSSSLPDLPHSDCVGPALPTPAEVDLLTNQMMRGRWTKSLCCGDTLGGLREAGESRAIDVIMLVLEGCEMTLRATYQNTSGYTDGFPSRDEHVDGGSIVEVAVADRHGVDGNEGRRGWNA